MGYVEWVLVEYITAKSKKKAKLINYKSTSTPLPLRRRGAPVYLSRITTEQPHK